MHFITTDNTKEGTQALAGKIVSFLNKGSKVLWLIPGGSNIPIATEAMNIIRSKLALAAPSALNHLTIALTDERYGPVGHPDSNWKQLQDTHIDLAGIKAYPILDGSSLAETVTRYGDTIEKMLKSTDVIVGQFGMGADGHIAGILPHMPAVSEEKLPTAGYESRPFTRVSLTFPILRKISVAYMFVSEATKKAAIDRLHEDGVSLDDQPAQILKEIPEVYVYID
jgi:6-phosphogluconolactonase/glucosamine-6-phosphate isomerase/deaminase